MFDRLEPAVADLRLLLATTARPRETRLPVMTPREAATQLHAGAARGWPVGLLFGGERAGLETQDIALAQGIVTVPVDLRFRSLNLAQAVALCAYEWRVAHDAGPPTIFPDAVPPAEQATMLGLYEHLEGELEAAGFFHPPEKRDSMVRNLRVALGRARFTDQEARTFRGVITALAKGPRAGSGQACREKGADDSDPDTRATDQTSGPRPVQGGLAGTRGGVRKSAGQSGGCCMDRRGFVFGGAALAALARTSSARADAATKLPIETDDLRSSAREAWVYGLPLIEAARLRADAIGR